jgi:hypothetical protein
MPLILGQKGSSRCCCGDCRGFPAFDGSHRFFRYATLYDSDCCLFGPCPDSNGKDGKIKLESTGCGYGIIVESTGNYEHYYQNGVCLDCKSRFPLDAIRSLLPQPGELWCYYLRCGNYYNSSNGVVNPTKATYAYSSQPQCCNLDGRNIYWELTEEITDATCSKVGACCGVKDSYSLGSVGPCRMCHECECDTAKGEIWNGEGSSCGTSNPCLCRGFKAFDGSDQWFRYARLIDDDNCFSHPGQPDGGVLVEWSIECGCYVSGWNTQIQENYGKIIQTEGAYSKSGYYVIGECRMIPTGHIYPSIHNSATFCSLGTSAICGNPEGDKIGWHLSEPVTCNPLP